MNSALSKNLKSIVSEKCPNCGKGDIFYKGAYFSFQIPKMHDHCPSCNYRFEREPGYFLGAMYLSYGLGVFEGILVFLLAIFSFPQIATIMEVGIVITTLILLSKLNFRLSRVIWLYLFPY